MTKNNSANNGKEAAGGKSLRSLDLDKIISKREAETPIGNVTIRQLTLDDLVAIQEAERDRQLDSLALIRLLIERTVTSSKSEEPLRDVEIVRLSADEGFLEKLVEAHPELYTDFDGAGAEREKPVVREPGENADAFLLRAWRDYDQQMRAQFKGIGETIRKNLVGLTGALSSSGLVSLAANKTASHQLQEAIDKATVTSSPWEVTRPDPLHLEHFRMPPNPIHETNQHLGELIASIEQMRELAIKTAEMQRGLNEVATEILDKFVTGATVAEQASAKNLLIAKFGLGIAILSVFVTLVVSILQLVMSGPSQSETDQMRRMERLSRSYIDESSRQSRMLEQVVKIEQLQLEQNVKAQEAAGRKAAQ